VVEELLAVRVARERGPELEFGPADLARVIGEDIDVVEELIVHRDLRVVVQHAAEQVRPRPAPCEHDKSLVLRAPLPPLERGEKPVAGVPREGPADEVGDVRDAGHF